MQSLSRHLLTLGLLLAMGGVAFAQTGSISGTVTDAADGEPLWGVLVRASDGSAPGGGGPGGGFFGGFGNLDITSVDGTYSIDDLLPGSYEVTARRFGYEPQTATVDVIDGEIATANFALAAPTFGAIAGTVTDGTGAPIAGAFVISRAANAGGGFFSLFNLRFDVTDDAGAYSLNNVSAGDHDVRVFASGFFPAEAMATVTADTTTTLDITMSGLTFGSVTGVVTDSVTGDPVEGAWVFVFGGPGAWQADQTDVNGAYTLDNVVTGTRLVRVFAPAYSRAMVEVEVLDGVAATANFVLDPR